MKGEKRPLLTADYEAMGLPERFWKVRFEDIKPGPAKDKLHKFLKLRFESPEREADGLFISGPVGSGKTYMTAFVAKVFKNYSYTTQWVDAQEFQGLANQFRSDDDGTWLNRFKAVDVLVVNDLGKEVVGHGHPNYLVDVISYRRDRNKPIVLNTSLEADQMAHKYGESFQKALLSTMLGIRTSGDLYLDLLKQIPKIYGI